MREHLRLSGLPTLKSWGMITHTYNCSSWEAEAGGFSVPDQHNGSIVRTCENLQKGKSEEGGERRGRWKEEEQEKERKREGTEEEGKEEEKRRKKREEHEEKGRAGDGRAGAGGSRIFSYQESR